MKKIILKRVVTIVEFLSILIGICARVQWVVKPDFGSHDGRGLGFLQKEENSVDVLFLGSSNMFCTINPIVLYEQTRITAYDWGSSSQSLNMTYMYLKEALKTQKPKVVCVEVLKVIGDHNHNLYESGMQWGFTYFPTNRNKVDGLQVQLGDKLDAEFLSYIFPIFRYKDRWKELQENDFKKDVSTWLKGCHYSELTKEVAYQDSYWEEFERDIEEANIDSLNAIRKLCEKEGIELVLFKSPTTSLWKNAYSLAVQEYVDQYGIPFVDYNTKIDELGIDLSSDFYDESHVNWDGQEKLTRHMGEFLLENYELQDHRKDEGQNSWDWSVEMLDQYCDNYDLKQETNLAAFIRKLKEEPYIVICQINGDNDEYCKKLVAEAFGVSGEQGAFAVDCLSGEALFNTNEETYSWYTAIDDVEFAVERIDGECSSYFNGKKFAGMENGVSFLIYDQKMEKLVCTVNFEANNEYQRS